MYGFFGYFLTNAGEALWQMVGLYQLITVLTAYTTMIMVLIIIVNIYRGKFLDDTKSGIPVSLLSGPLAQL